jgi:hypothetical protein
MLIDCDVCLARDNGVCGDCVVSFILPLTRGSAETLSLEDEEVEALTALAEQGLIPRLRLITAEDDGPEDLAG